MLRGLQATRWGLCILLPMGRRWPWGQQAWAGPSTCGALHSGLAWWASPWGEGLAAGQGHQGHGLGWRWVMRGPGGEALGILHRSI